MFLADRIVRGTCPKCGAADQYGDNCEVCGATYSPADLIKPYSALSGAPPVEKQVTQLFFDLPRFENMLRSWTRSGALQPEVANKLAEWLEAGLQPWDISREAPYFVFEIPGYPGKYFYVWLDAPIGYMASFKNLCDKKGLDFDSYWKPGSDAEIYHFIGKDILYFHALFWPATLKFSGYRTPTKVCVHGFLTVNGQKMSKSKGNTVAPQKVINNLGADILRLWVAATDYSKEMTVSDEILKRSADTYRRLRNTSRYLLSNLSDFDPINNMLEPSEMLALDQWAVRRAGQIQTQVKAAYESYEFHRIYQLVHNFCSVDMGGFYLDIVKDRQYTAQPDSLARRSAQTAIFHVLEAMSRWMAPVLSFTAEEIWQSMPGERGESVFLESWYQFPEINLGELDLSYWGEVVEVRDAVNRELEQAQGPLPSSRGLELTRQHQELIALDPDLPHTHLLMGLVY